MERKYHIDNYEGYLGLNDAISALLEIHEAEDK